MDSIPAIGLGRIIRHLAGYEEFLQFKLVCVHWCQSAVGADLQGFVAGLAQRCCLPDILVDRVKCKAVGTNHDWVQFCTQQLRLQMLLAGKYMGIVTPENISAHVPLEAIDWEQPMKTVAELRPSTTSRRGMIKQRLVVDNSFEEVWQVCYDWIVLDRRIALDRAIWKLISPCTLEAPETRWEDGDLHCGVRGVADFRPAVDPTFLDLCELVLVMCPHKEHANRSMVCWSMSLFAPCAWMLPKRACGLEELDHHAYFRQDSTAAALVLGKQLERAVSFPDLECLVKVTKPAQQAPAPPTTSGRRKRVQKEKYAEPRDFRSGRNPKGLNLYIPRRKSGDFGSSARPGGEPAVRPKCQVLTCEATGDLDAFLQQHRPTVREAEQICVWRGGENLCNAQDLQGLLDDGARLEKTGSLSQATVVQLAKKWKILTGKWLLSVPDWRIDELFALASQRVREGQLKCFQLVVHTPMSDQKRFMISAHAPDFTDQKSVMSLGKSLRAAARHGLRCPSGDWGELLDDPFAAPEKKVSLVFKPDVFSRLSLHKNNPYGIKTTLFVLDL